MVQVVHYPLMAKVSNENYVEYQQLHERMITPVVGVPMLIEIVTAILLLNDLPKGSRQLGFGLQLGSSRWRGWQPRSSQSLATAS